jgi:pimeloyl-ACP methyl ester carboxylesterase
MAPHRLSGDDHVSLWSRITCPTLLLHAEESFLASADTAGLASYFQQARAETIAGAGHWLHHEKPDEVLRAIRTFLGLTDGRPQASFASSRNGLI